MENEVVDIEETLLEETPLEEERLVWVGLGLALD